MSLRAQVAWVIALLSAVPNLFLVGALLIPAYSRADQLTANLWWQLALWLLALAVVSGSVGYFLSRHLLAPLAGVARDLEALPRSGARLGTARLPVDAVDPPEVVGLKTAFNGLLAHIQVEQGRRSSFMATLMHDLKTPLVAANHLLGVVRDSDRLSREDRIDVVARLVQENHALIELVQKMVDAHRLEREDVPIQREDVDVGALVGNVIERLEPLARERGVRIDVHGGGGARVDPKEMERAVYNLLSNAVRYARERIDVEAYPGLLRIRDDGPGLPGPLEQLAQPFNGQPMEIAGQRYTAGTGGLGLFIARRVLEAHGGRLVLEATGSQGTVLLAYLGRETGSSYARADR